VALSTSLKTVGKIKKEDFKARLIDNFRMLGIGLELACIRRSCRDIIEKKLM